MFRRSSMGLTPLVSFPCTSTRPSSGIASAFTIFNSVVLPQPELPMMVTNAPSSMSRFASSTATASPNRLLTCSNATAGVEPSSAGAARDPSTSRCALRSGWQIAKPSERPTLSSRAQATESPESRREASPLGKDPARRQQSNKQRLKQVLQTKTERCAL